MKAADVMTRNVVSVGADETVLHAIRLMLQHRISAVPVLDAAGKLTGVLSEGDLLRRAETGTERRRTRWLDFFAGPGGLAEDYVRAHAKKVHELMTRDVVTVAAETPLEEVVRLMEKHRVKRLPVTEDGKIVGIVGRANLLRALAVLGAGMTPPSEGDAHIKARILGELERQAWAPKVGLDIVVRDGVVHVWGVVTDDSQRAALTVLAENVPGVKRVEDHLVWIEPMTGMVLGPDAATAEAPAGRAA